MNTLGRPVAISEKDILGVTTVNPLYTDTRYNDKIRYTDNLTSTKTLSQEVTVDQNLCRNILFNTSSNILFWIFVKISKTYIIWRNKNKTWHLLHIILLIKSSLQQQIYFNGNNFGNIWCRCNEGSQHLLYRTSSFLWKRVYSIRKTKCSLWKQILSLWSRPSFRSGQDNFDLVVSSENEFCPLYNRRRSCADKRHPLCRLKIALPRQNTHSSLLP